MTGKQVEKALAKLFKKHGIENKVSIEDIKNWIWNATGDPMEASNKFQKKCMDLFPPMESIDELNEILQIFVSAWNTFPHKELKGKTPNELFKENMKTAEKSDQFFPSQPKVIVGGQEMEFDEYFEMLKEMERVQKPFKKWIEKELLPNYEKYLKSNFKKTHIQKKHSEVADIFFQRVLHVGFVDLESIRPEFITREFPSWWPTHVLQSTLKPHQVAKSLMTLFRFIDNNYE